VRRKNNNKAGGSWPRLDNERGRISGEDRVKKKVGRRGKRILNMEVAIY
jgi:hypothetical protein